MKFFPSFHTILSIGSFELRWYPVLLCTGSLLLYWFTVRDLKAHSYPEDTGDDLFIGCAICAVIGARLWYCLLYDFSYYFSNPIRILKTWEGGLAIHGAILGGVLYVLYYCYKKRYSPLRILDCVFPNMLIGQALGRWGNFFNQEAFGRIVSEEFYKGWPSFIKDHMLIDGAYQEPTFLYESLANLCGFLLIRYVYKRFSKPRRGDLVYAYTMWYGITRFFIEGLRSDSLMIGNIKMAQLISVLGILFGVLGMLGVFRRFAKKPAVLFDFDQTLVQSRELIWESFRQVFAKHLPEHPFGKEEKEYVIGPTLEESFVHFGFREDPKELAKEYREVHKSLQERIKASPNALELLRKLKEEGYQTGVVTTKYHESIDAGMPYLGFGEYLDVIVAGEDVKKFKPDPEGIFQAIEKLKGSRDNMVYVGDVAQDVQTGINAGAFTIGYNIDPAENAKLQEAGANRVINDLNEVLMILKEDHEWTTAMN